MSDEMIETDVLVVGGGPAGLSTALTLARHGVDVLAVTKYRSTANTPRAHITNQRTVEVFRDLGIEDEVLRVATPRELMANNVWATSFTGDEIARLRTWGNCPVRQSEYDRASPSPMCNIPQHLLEPIMAAAVTRAGGHLRFSTELEDFVQDDKGVTATVCDRLSGRRQTIRAKYMVGADGANSRVADQLGLPMLGEHGLGAALNVWIEADLTRFCEHRPGVLYWMLRPGNDYWVGSGTFVCVRPWTEWAVLFMYDPNEGEPDTSEEALRERLIPVIGDETVPITIKSVGKWQINHVVAEQYSRGRVFCAGDAVHRHPPANGLGSNTSIQDGYNLGWKLAYVLKGYAPPALLDTYSEERQPVGREVVDRAMQSVADMKPIADALGFEPGQSEEEGWSKLESLKEGGVESEKARHDLRDAISLQNYQFNCHGIELGQIYERGAVLPDATMARPEKSDPLVYVAKTDPGCRLPHVWVTRDHKRVSTIDLVPFGGFLLVTGPDGDLWRKAAESLDFRGVPLVTASIGPGLEYEDPYFDWLDVRDIRDDGAILVRPDRHIAFKSRGAVSDASATLRSVLMTILRHEEEASPSKPPRNEKAEALSSNQ